MTKTTTTRHLAAFALLLLASACGEAGLSPRVCATSAAIVDGSISTEERSTVYVGGGCTGVLVGPTTVLTSAHCHDIAFYVTHNGLVASVWERIPHPGYPENKTDDIEVLVLEDPLPGPYATLGSPEVGEATVQGYGLDDEGESGTLREATSYIDIVTDAYAYTVPGPGACFGDSGGPLYQNGAVVALTTQGRGEECGSGSVNVAVDFHRDWLELVSPDSLAFLDPSC